MSIDFKIGFTKTFTTTLTATVGTTTGGSTFSPAPRQANPVFITSDADTIYIAPDGNDGNAGTIAAPVLTIANAFSKMGGAKITMHFLENGSGLPMVWSLSTAETLASTWNMQCLYGYIATINFTADATIACAGDNDINGFQMNDSETRTISGNMLKSTGSGVRVKSCSLKAFATQHCIGWDFVTGTVACVPSYVFFDGQGISGPTNSLMAVNNCVFVSNQSGAFSAALSIGTTTNPAGTQTVNIEQCMFLDFERVIEMADEAASFHIYNFDGCAFESCDYVGELGGVATNEANLNLDYCHNRATKATTEGTGLVNLAEDNAADPDISPLYESLDNLRSNDPEGARLRWKGKATGNGGKYFLTSVLAGHYTPDGTFPDVNPFEEITVLTLKSFAETVSVQWPPGSFTKTFKPVGAISLTDVVGNPHVGLDAIKRVFRFDFGSGSEYANNNDLRKLVRLLSNSGTLQMFPQGVSANLFTDPSTGLPDSVQGIFDTADNSVTPIISSGFPMIERNWQGFIVEIATLPYYVASNDTAKMVLTDLFSNGWPAAGVHTFAATSFLVVPNIQDLTATQEFFTKFQDGGGFRENSQAFAAENSLAHELKGYSIEFMETSGLDE